MFTQILNSSKYDRIRVAEATVWVCLHVFTMPGTLLSRQRQISCSLWLRPRRCHTITHALFEKKGGVKNGVVLAWDISNKIVQHKYGRISRRNKRKRSIFSLPWSLVGHLVQWKQTFCTTSPLSPPNSITHAHTHQGNQINTENIEKCLLSRVFLEYLFALETAGCTEVLDYISK